jgi:hypothetical protein
MQRSVSPDADGHPNKYQPRSTFFVFGERGTELTEVATADP